MMRLSFIPIITFCAVFCTAHAAEGGDANLIFRLEPGQVVRYQWGTSKSSECTGRNLGKEFKIKQESSTEMTVMFKALPKRVDTPGQPLLIKIENYSYKDKKSIDTEVGEVVASRSKVKVTQNGKPIADSDNDINPEEIKSFQQMIKQIEDGEMRVSIDAAGKFMGEATGDSQVIEFIKSTGAESLPRILAGRTIAPGEQWADSQTIAYIASFKLAKPVTVRSTATFKGWEEKAGKKLAKIDIDAVWDNADLKGENDEGLLVEITRVQGASAGTCLFDSATGQYAEGRFDVLSKCRIDGKFEGQSTGMDMTGNKMSFWFKQVSKE